jgi:hypothetical protein
MGHGVFLAQTHLPGTLVNKADRKGRGSYKPRPFPRYVPPFG